MPFLKDVLVYLSSSLINSASVHAFSENPINLLNTPHYEKLVEKNRKNQKENVFDFSNEKNVEVGEIVGDIESRLAACCIKTGFTVAVGQIKAAGFSYRFVIINKAGG